MCTRTAKCKQRERRGRTGEAELEGLDPEQLLGVGAHPAARIRRSSSARGRRRGRGELGFGSGSVPQGARGVEESEGNLAGVAEGSRSGEVGVVLVSCWET